jgi:hypothetical protein
MPQGDEIADLWSDCVRGQLRPGKKSVRLFPVTHEAGYGALIGARRQPVAALEQITGHMTESDALNHQDAAHAAVGETVRALGIEGCLVVDADCAVVACAAAVGCRATPTRYLTLTKWQILPPKTY